MSLRVVTHSLQNSPAACASGAWASVRTDYGVSSGLVRRGRCTVLAMHTPSREHRTLCDPNALAGCCAHTECGEIGRATTGMAGTDSWD